MDKAIVDSGTTLLRLPSNVFNALVDAITRSSLVGRRSALRAVETRSPPSRLSDPGLLLRLLGRQQAGLLGEGGDALEVLPQAVHLPEGQQQQPVLQDHHPAPGTVQPHRS